MTLLLLAHKEHKKRIMSFLFSSLLTVLAFLLSPTVVLSSQNVLEAVKCSATLPTGTTVMSSINVGNGKIYLFGGYTSPGGLSNGIHLYDVNSDTRTRVGDLPTGTYGSALAEDSLGNIYHFGGWDLGSSFLDTIVRFNTSSRVTEIVGHLPKGIMGIGSVQTKVDSALVFGAVDILEVDLRTLQVSHATEKTEQSSGVAWDGGDRVLLFYATEHQVYSISGNNFTDFTSPDDEPHDFLLHHSVISTPKSAWIVGNDGITVGRGNGIFEVDFETLEFKFWPVDNYPGGPGGYFRFAATAYVPELHRLYMFGGYNFTYRTDIWYIDLPGRDELTTTPLPITTTPPPSPGFDCSNRTDGFYPSPYACDRYFGCRGGETFEFQCSPPFHFNPDLEVCDLPEVVNCELSCSAKEDGLYPHPHYCSFYLRCLEGVGRVLECPSPLLFDREELKCNFPDLVNCSSSVIAGSNSLNF